VKKAVIYGAGNIYKYMKKQVKSEYDIIAFLDDDRNRWNTYFDGIKIYPPQQIKQIDYDVVLVATTKYETVLNNLLNLNVKKEKIKKMMDLIAKEGSGIFTDEKVKIIFESSQDRCAIGEIFEENIIVLDIGMNIGAASLYFAKMENVYRVYGYEPFPITYDKAMKNFEINPDLKTKIFATNAGIGNCDQKNVLDYCEQVSGSMSTIPDLNNEFKERHGANYNFTKTEIEIIDIYNELVKISSLHKNCPIICKIDCEGYESKIIERLYKTNMLEKIDALMMECHDNEGKNKIITILLNQNFLCFDFRIKNYNNSMIYASNRTRKLL